MDNIRHIAHLTISENRGRPRLWVDGKRLADIGAVRGSRFDLTTDPAGQQIVIDITETGARKVSGKPDGRPVIDVVGQQVGAVFPAGTQVQVVFQPGRITVSVRPRDGAAAERAARLARKLANGDPLDVGALSFGMGVLDAAIAEGLHAAGIKTHLRWAVDIDGDALEHAATRNPVWRPDTISVAADMAQVDPALLPRVDAIVAGLPCVSHSRAGRAKQRSQDRGLTHPEGHEAGSLFVDLIRFVVAMNPAVVVLENVTQFLNSAAYACLKVVLGKLQFSVTETTLEATDFGCNERRERMVMVANTGAPIDLTGLAPNIPPAPLAAVLEDIPASDPRWRSHAHHVAKQERGADKGQNFKLQLVRSTDRVVGTIGAGYARDRTTEPHIQSAEDPTRSRLLTVKEHARIKRVPEALVEGLGHTFGHKLLGQGIAFTPFVAVGRRLGSALKGRTLHRSTARVAVTARPVPQVQLPPPAVAQTVMARRARATPPLLNGAEACPGLFPPAVPASHQPLARSARPCRASCPSPSPRKSPPGAVGPHRSGAAPK
ncbi:DNA cytosine methyltransferase [Azospirillum sp. sgz302134]